MAQFKEFDATMFETFAGAEGFADGAPPMYADVKVDGSDGLVVIDGNGAEVVWGDGYNQVVLWYGTALRFAATLKDSYTEAELRWFETLSQSAANAR